MTVTPVISTLIVTGSTDWAAVGDVTMAAPEDLVQPVEGGDCWPTALGPLIRSMCEEWVAAGEPAQRKSA